MKSYFDKRRNLGVEFPNDSAIDIPLNSLSSSYHQFIMNYNMNNLDKTLMELHGMLKSAKASLLKAKGSNSTTPILATRHGGANNKKFYYFKDKTKVGPSNQDLKRKSDSK